MQILAASVRACPFAAPQKLGESIVRIHVIGEAGIVRVGMSVIRRSIIPIEMTLRPGSVFVVPKGLWHSPRPRGMVSLLFMSNDAGSEISNKKDPRRAA